MSVQVLNWVFQHSGATGNDRMVLLVLADNAQDDGSCAYPSHETIAWKAGGISDRTVRNCLRRLEAAGRIEREGWSKKHTISYRVVMDEPERTRKEFPGSTRKALFPGSDPATRKSEVGNPESIVSDEPSYNRPSRDNNVNERSAKAIAERGPKDGVERVFLAWVQATERRPGSTVLTATRADLIRRRLAEYPELDLLDAVRGWRHSKHHRGENEDGAVYNDLELCLRINRQGNWVEKFRDLERGQRKRPAVADPLARMAARPATDDEGELAA